MNRKSAYGKVTNRIIESLRDIVGEKHVICQDTDAIEPYSHDETHGRQYSGLPGVVVRPVTAGEISRIIRLAGAERIPVTPRGAGSGLSGGAVALFGGILISMERMNRIIEIDAANMMAVVEPGVVTNDLNLRARAEGLYFAGYPMSIETCFIGGNVASNAGGGRAVKYGVTGRYVLGLEVVLPSAEIVRFGGKRVKDVTGYNMVQLLAGSEGTLGIFTEITLRLLPLPRAGIDMLVHFPDEENALRLVPLIMNRLGIVPAGVEFMDRLSLDIACAYLGTRAGYAGVGSILLIELDGESMEELQGWCLEIDDLCREQGALNSFLATGPAEREKIWRVRKIAGEAYSAHGSILSAEDIVVPPGSLAGIIPRLQELSEKYGLLLPSFGHVGDGNLHVTVLQKPGDKRQRSEEVLPRLLTDLYLLAVGLGGTISGEHGIGHKRSRYLPLVMSEAEIGAMKKIKEAFDPHNIMNPGKIF